LTVKDLKCSRRSLISIYGTQKYHNFSTKRQRKKMPQKEDEVTISCTSKFGSSEQWNINHYGVFSDCFELNAQVPATNSPRQEHGHQPELHGLRTPGRIGRISKFCISWDCLHCSDCISKPIGKRWSYVVLINIVNYSILWETSLS